MDINQDNRQTAQSINMAEIAVRGAKTLFDIQLATTRSILQMQTRSAAAFGAPDYSELFQSADEGAKRLFETSADQFLDSARQASETITEMQRQFDRMVEHQTVQITENMRRGIDDVSQRTRQSLEEVRTQTLQQAEQAQQIADNASRQAHSNGGQAQEAPDGP